MLSGYRKLREQPVAGSLVRGEGTENMTTVERRGNSSCSNVQVPVAE